MRGLSTQTPLVDSKSMTGFYQSFQPRVVFVKATHYPPFSFNFVIDVLEIILSSSKLVKTAFLLVGSLIYLEYADDVVLFVEDSDVLQLFGRLE